MIKHHVARGTSIQDLNHPRLRKPRRGLQILDSRVGFLRPSRNVVIDSISLLSSVTLRIVILARSVRSVHSLAAFLVYGVRRLASHNVIALSLWAESDPARKSGRVCKTVTFY